MYSISDWRGSIIWMLGAFGAFAKISIEGWFGFFVMMLTAAVAGVADSVMKDRP